MGGDPAEMPPGVKANFIRTMTLAMMVEAVEALDETHWKPWATPPAGAPTIVDKTRYTNELADVFIFLMNLMLAGGVTMRELAEAVDAKQTKNILRQVEGYDGKSGKCPRCGRAYDDAGVTCKPRGETDFTKLTGTDAPPYCGEVNRHVSESTGEDRSL
jgi:hypothetical protein